MKRRTILSLAGAAAASATLPTLAGPTLPHVEVYKNPDCGCCGAWVDHLKTGSCHTGLVAGYALEGHVPAADIKRLLAQKPAAAGLAVPGMPVGAPGMEMGSRKDPFQVLLIDKAGRSSVFAAHPNIQRRFT